AQEEIGKVQSGPGHRLATGVELAGGETGKVESPAAVGIGGRGGEVTIVAASESPVVLFAMYGESLAKTVVVDVAPRRAAIGERAEVGRAERRRPKVDGI